MGKIENLKKIKHLLDEGLISRKEFEKLKLDIIVKPNSNDSNIDNTIENQIYEDEEFVKEENSENPENEIIKDYEFCPACNNPIKENENECSDCGLVLKGENDELPLNYISGKADNFFPS